MLKYKLIPSEDKNSRALMVMLHGLGDSIEGYRWFPEAMGLPWMNYALVNAPDEYYGGYSWYNIAGDHAPGVIRSRKLVFDLLDDLRQQGFATGLTTLGGFSQGCLMAMDVALRYPQKLAGVVGISGYVFEAEKSLTELSAVAKEQRFLVTHGTLDPIVAFARTKTQVQRLQAAGLQIEWREFTKAHTIEGETEMNLIRDFVCGGYSAASTPR